MIRCVPGFPCDVTQEDQIDAAFAAKLRANSGGADIVVANAGLASSAPVRKKPRSTSGNRNYEVLAKVYFLTARAAFPLLKKSAGSLVFIEFEECDCGHDQRARPMPRQRPPPSISRRCLALEEGAPFGVRVNVVNPDVRFSGAPGSGREAGVRNARRPMASMKARGLEEHYRSRSLLKRDVFPEDVAEAVYFLASDASSKSTGNIINVDAGNVQTFTR